MLQKPAVPNNIYSKNKKYYMNKTLNRGAAEIESEDLSWVRTYTVENQRCFRACPTLQQRNQNNQNNKYRDFNFTDMKQMLVINIVIALKFSLI